MRNRIGLLTCLAAIFARSAAGLCHPRTHVESNNNEFSFFWKNRTSSYEKRIQELERELEKSNRKLSWLQWQLAVVPFVVLAVTVVMLLLFAKALIDAINTSF